MTSMSAPTSKHLRKIHLQRLENPNGPSSNIASHRNQIAKCACASLIDLTSSFPSPKRFFPPDLLHTDQHAAIPSLAIAMLDEAAERK